jgi:flagellar basal body L-ring protein FlgH
MKARTAAALFLITAYSMFADSLWDPDSSGFLTGVGDLKAGDIILISINLNQDLTYSSSRVDSERVSIELSGGEGQGLFSFLPSGGSSGNQSLNGSSSAALQTSLAVRITAIDENGQLILQGGRVLAIQGKEESITLTGVADPALIDQDRTLPFSSVVDARLVYDTFLSTGVPLIRAGDLEDKPAASAVAVTEGDAAAGDTPAVVSETATSPVLTEDKRRDLLLIYLNRLIDLVFE